MDKPDFGYQSGDSSNQVRTARIERKKTRKFIFTAYAGLALLYSGMPAEAESAVYASPVSINQIYQIDADAGSSFPAMTGVTSYVGGGTYMNGSLYYQSGYYGVPYLKEFSRYDLTTGAVSLAFTQDYNDASFVSNGGGLAADSSNSRLFYSYGNSKVWAVTLGDPSSSPVELWDASALGLQRITDVAYATNQIYIAGQLAYEPATQIGRIVRGTFSEEDGWSWDTITIANASIGLTVDEAGGSLYWSGVEGSNGGYSVYRSNLDGSNTVELLNSTTNYVSLAYDAKTDALFLASSDYGPIMKMDLSLGTLAPSGNVGGFGPNLSVGDAVPEPSTWILVGLGSAVCFLRGRKR